MIGDKSCLECKFSYKENDGGRTCRKNPPTGHPVFVMERGVPTVRGVVGCWPSVNDDAFCHEFQRRGAIQ